MIASIHGEISQILDNQVVITLSGLGLLVNITEATCLDCHLGMQQTFHTYLVVREDQLSLYGFATTEERDLFVHLIGVAGSASVIASRLPRPKRDRTVINKGESACVPARFVACCSSVPF